MSVIRGVFSDTHIPFQHPNYLRFVKDTFEEYGVQEVIMLGDLVDNHAISHFQSEPCADSAYTEIERARQEIKTLTETFPDVRMCRGNHDDRIFVQAASIGLGDIFVRPFREIYRLPMSWTLEDEYVLDNVLYTHGTGHSGKNAALNMALQERMSVCIGHLHTFGGVQYSANSRDTVFGMNTGCLTDDRAYAFAYGKHNNKKPTLGCGIVFDSDYALFIPMTGEYLKIK